MSRRARRVFVLGMSLGVIGLAAWGARMLAQGEPVVWTDVRRVFWQPDPTLGWIETAERWAWLGLDGLALTAAVVLGTAALHVTGRRLHARPGPARAIGLLSLVGAGLSALAPVLPTLAFLSGMPPAGAERLMPMVAASYSLPEAAALPGGASAPLPVPGGRWVVADAAHNLVVARIAAGGETFDGKLGPVSGEIALDVPGRTRGRIEVPAGSLETGIELRDTHARGYLEVDKHPLITLSILGLDAIEGVGSARTFTARAEVSLMGKTVPVTVTGTLATLEEAQRRELGISHRHALLASARFPLSIAAVGLDRDNFDADEIALNARLVLVPDAAPPEPGTL